MNCISRRLQQEKLPMTPATMKNRHNPTNINFSELLIQEKMKNDEKNAYKNHQVDEGEEEEEEEYRVFRMN